MSKQRRYFCGCNFILAILLKVSLHAWILKYFIGLEQLASSRGCTRMSGVSQKHFNNSKACVYTNGCHNNKCASDDALYTLFPYN